MRKIVNINLQHDLAGSLLISIMIYLYCIIEMKYKMISGKIRLIMYSGFFSQKRYKVVLTR